MFIVLDFKVYFFDELMVGMSVDEVFVVFDLICVLKVEKKYMLLFVEYKMDVVCELVDCIIVLY